MVPSITLKQLLPLLRYKLCLNKTLNNLTHSRSFATGCILQFPRGIRPKIQRSNLIGLVKPLASIENPKENEYEKKPAEKEIDLELHRPVMLEEIINFLQPADKEVYLDMTFGAGGHTKAILESNPSAVVYALDRDPVAYQIANNLAEDYRSRLHPILGRFSSVDSLLKEEGVGLEYFHGVLIDAGCSSMQFDNPERGFALSQDGPLDMRMDGERSSSNPSAADVVNTLDVSTLARIFKTYGEERQAKKVASMIVNYREKHKQIESTQELATVISLAFTHRDASSSKDGLGRRLHVATRTFQALRIFVNDELNELYRGLLAVKPFLKSRGKLVVLTFHSLEDRIVKRFLQGKDVNEVGRTIHQRRLASDWTTDEREIKSPDWEVVNKKVLYASEFEVSQNPRSRSAKLRAAYKV